MTKTSKSTTDVYTPECHNIALNSIHDPILITLQLLRYNLQWMMRVIFDNLGGVAASFLDTLLMLLAL